MTSESKRGRRVPRSRETHGRTSLEARDEPIAAKMYWRGTLECRRWKPISAMIVGRWFRNNGVSWSISASDSPSSADRQDQTAIHRIKSYTHARGHTAWCAQRPAHAEVEYSKHYYYEHRRDGDGNECEARSLRRTRDNRIGCGVDGVGYLVREVHEVAGVVCKLAEEQLRLDLRPSKCNLYVPVRWVWLMLSDACCCMLEMHDARCRLYRASRTKHEQVVQ